jgi:transposase
MGVFAMKKSAQHLIVEVARRHFRTEMTIGIDLGDVWSHFCTLNEEGRMVDRGRSEPLLKQWRSGLPR